MASVGAILPFWMATKWSSITWVRRTTASRSTMRAAPLREWAARIISLMRAMSAGSSSRASRPSDKRVVWLSASRRKSSIIEASWYSSPAIF